MYGKNPIRPPVTGDGDSLDVQRIFPTLQGEGPYAGMPAVFVRLGGCNLACGFCDTEFESFTRMGVGEIVERVEALASSIIPLSLQGEGKGEGPSRMIGGPLLNPLPEGRGDQGRGDKRVRNLIVLTGGEPLRQPIEKLCVALIERGFKVQIETNGTLYRELPPQVEIVCSPKNTGQGYFPLRNDLLARVNAFKFIISAQQKDYSDIADVGQGDIPVYVQPMDEYDEAKNAANLALAMQLAQTHGYRLSLQLHKIMGIE